MSEVLEIGNQSKFPKRKLTKTAGFPPAAVAVAADLGRDRCFASSSFRRLFRAVSLVRRS
jgi:hypothetical protein